MYVVYSMFFLMFKHWFCWKYQYNKYMFNFIDLYSFIPVSGCVGRSPSILLCSGTRMLLRQPWVVYHICHITCIQSHKWMVVIVRGWLFHSENTEQMVLLFLLFQKYMYASNLYNNLFFLLVKFLSSFIKRIAKTSDCNTGLISAAPNSEL